jgi:methylmalonyl-CoA mutase
MIGDKKVVATAFQDIGFEVIIGPLFQTPKEAAVMGIENNVDIIAASSLAAGTSKFNSKSQV